MTLEEIWTALAVRSIAVDASPAEKAARWLEAERAVKAAGKHFAGPAWALVRDMQDVDMIAAFNEQVVAFKATAPAVAEEPAKVRPSSYRRETVKVRFPRGVEI